ncbi:hypothetical protein A1351_04335 [Methylosinus sp. R-45379]|nr:hypothetical protein A1351_04335 [Methylosinus sp. R-45379]
MAEGSAHRLAPEMAEKARNSLFFEANSERSDDSAPLIAFGARVPIYRTNPFDRNAPSFSFLVRILIDRTNSVRSERALTQR